MTARTRARKLDDAVLVKCLSIHSMIAAGILRGSKVLIAYSMTRRAVVSDLEAIEKGIDGLLRGVLRDLGMKPGRKRLFRFDLASFKHKDDGDETLTVELDFAKLLPFERTAEMVALADRLDKSAEAARRRAGEVER